MNQEGTLTIDGIEYKESDLNEDQLYLVAQIKDLQGRAGIIRLQGDQVQVALDVFIQQLKLSLEKKDGPTNSSDQLDP
jgi:hypothetical protein